MPPTRPLRGAPDASTGLLRRSDKRLALAMILVVIAVIAAFVRIFWDYENVFDGPVTRFPSSDPWTHVRQVEFLVQHFPYRLSLDPYGVYPGGQSIAVAPLLDYFAAIVAILGTAVFRHDSITHLVCAFVPPILAALTTTAGYFVARKMFNRATGLLTALLIAIAPGVHYSSSVLGFFDHHVLEVLLSTLVMLTLLRAHQSAAGEAGRRRRGPTDGSVLGRSLMFGLMLALYLLTWIGGSFLVLIIAAWVLSQSIAEHFSARNVRSVRNAVLPGIVLALGAIAPLRDAYPLARHQLASLVATLILSLGLPVLSELTHKLRLARWYYAMFVVLIGSAAAATMYRLDPSLFDRVLSGLNPSDARSAAKTIGEVRSLFWSGSGMTLAPAWQFFATGYPLAMVGLIVVAYRAVRYGRSADLLALVWSGGVLVAMFGQLRFGYYAAVNIALLSALACLKAIEHARILPGWLTHEDHLPPAPPSGGNDRRTPARRSSAPLPRGASNEPRWVGAVLLLWLVAIAVVPPAVVLSRIVGRYTGPNDAWIEALLWMRDETPEPFGDASAYFARPEHQGSTTISDEAPSAYGVLCWWDYGYWITGLARRIPNANPTQRGATESASFYVATDEAKALTMLQKRRSRYVLVDDALPFLPTAANDATLGLFEALTRWADRPSDTFFEELDYRDAAGRMQSVTLYYPAYFETMCVRLYLYGGERFTPTGPFQVATFTTARDASGRPSKRLERIHSFDSQAEASAFLARPENDGARLVSDDPTRSCVPLEPLSGIRPAFGSSAKRDLNGSAIAQVRIFEVDLDEGASATDVGASGNPSTTD